MNTITQLDYLKGIHLGLKLELGKINGRIIDMALELARRHPNEVGDLGSKYISIASNVNEITDGVSNFNKVLGKVEMYVFERKELDNMQIVNEASLLADSIHRVFSQINQRIDYAMEGKN